MMRKEVVLVTGAAGEMGQALIARLADSGAAVLALDVNPLPESLRQRCQVALTGDILDEKLLSRLVTEFAIPLIYHLAAVLSTRAEYSPEAAHRINVEGTLALLRLATEQGGWLGHPVTILFEDVELVTVTVSVFIVALISLDGKCHWLEGAQLLAAYIIVALAFFFVPA